jgi:hypothetical protein
MALRALWVTVVSPSHRARKRARGEQQKRGAVCDARSKRGSNDDSLCLRVDVCLTTLTALPYLVRLKRGVGTLCTDGHRQAATAEH